MPEISLTIDIDNQDPMAGLNRANAIMHRIATELHLEEGDTGFGFGQRDMIFVLAPGQDAQDALDGIRAILDQEHITPVNLSLIYPGLTTEDLIPLFLYLESRHGLNPRGSLKDGTFTWDCDHTRSKTERWLKRHKEFDKGEVLDFLDNHGGFCDCEVLFNCAALLHEGEEE